MQVCAVNDATDEEILEVCNGENPSGTSAGWNTVIRTEKDLSASIRETFLPIACDEIAGRTHFL
ncbi:MAG: hypothetical protein WC549_09405, partial [Actinomycetota bacterium]